MTTLRLMTPEELFASQNLTPLQEQLLYPARKYRWHCSKCGRMVKFATVRKVQPSGPDWIDEHEYTGECKVHGHVDVNWPET